LRVHVESGIGLACGGALEDGLVFGLTIRYMNTKELSEFVARVRPEFEALATEVAKRKQ
jgi:hypothetical protein